MMSYVSLRAQVEGWSARLFIVTCFIPLLHLYVDGHEMANTQKSSFIKRIIFQHQLLHRGR